MKEAEIDLTTNCGKLPKEFNLSDKLKTKAELFSNRASSDEGEKSFLFKEDVKEFIKRLKKEIRLEILDKNVRDIDKLPLDKLHLLLRRNGKIIPIIDKLAGDKLK